MAPAVPRTVEVLEMPTGAALLAVLPRLADALAGTGPALAPVATGDGEPIRNIVRKALALGAELAATEDDLQDPTAVVIATSGSTGIPKGALLSRSALIASAAATQRRLGPPGTWLLTLPAHHIAGLQVLLRSLAGGTDPQLMDTSLPFTAGRFLAAVDALPAGARYVSLVPTQLHRILTDTQATAALGTFSAVLVGGAATAAPLVTRARAVGIPLVTSYGMSETCGGCIYDGVPLDGVTAELDETGRVVLSGPVVARGYRGRPEDPAFDLTSGTRTFRTDDVGDMEGGRLRILGRADDVLTTGGLKVAPAELEAAMLELPGITDAIAVGVPDPEWGDLVVAVIVPAGRPPGLAEIREACTAAGSDPAVVPRELVLVDELPLRGPGKPDRNAARALAVDHLLERQPAARAQRSS